MTTLDDGEDPFIPAPRILTNRQKSRTAKLGLFWCYKCDRNKVGQVGKCSVCGHRENRKKTK